MTDKKLEARLENTERALVMLSTLLEDNLPEHICHPVNLMMEEYFYANITLGSNIHDNVNEPFITKDTLINNNERKQS